MFRDSGTPKFCDPKACMPMFVFEFYFSLVVRFESRIFIDSCWDTLSMSASMLFFGKKCC